MSLPSTPRSTRSASSAGNSPNILTPGQKIKAMMAEFDSDSETDTNYIKTSRPISKLELNTENTSTWETRQSNHISDASDDSDDADDFVRPKGRMASRMQAKANASPEKDTAFSRLSNALRKEQEQAKKNSPTLEESSEDDLPAAAPKRRNRGKASQSPAQNGESRRSPSRSRTASPLFVSSPAASQNETTKDKNEDEQIEEQPKSNARFLALVAQKRKEREEREKIEVEQKAAKRAQMEQFSSEMLSGEDSEADDPGSAQRLSQKARQPRKASKKALEEMSRETQRMSRNMQLAHQAQTKKKITKESFFARFNFMQPENPATEAPVANSSSTAGSQHSSDGENAQQKNDTPHTSPVLGPLDADKPMTDISAQTQSEIDGADKDMETAAPTLNEAFVTAHDVPKKLKEPFVAAATSTEPKLDVTKPMHEPRKMNQQSVRVIMSRHDVAQNNQDDSDSDDLEVVTSPAKARRIAAFENLPTRQMQESTSMTRLKALAHLTSPTRKTTSMTSAELSASLLYRARQQAAKERRERIDELRAKGVVIETAEERAAMEDDVENLVEKARQEADEIARQERAARKKAQGLDEDDEDDDDFVFSGSDDNASGEDDEEDDGMSVNGKLEFLDQEADESDESADEKIEIAPSDLEDTAPGSRRKRRTRVVSDDEEEEEPQVPSTPVRPPPSNAPQSAERPQFLGMQTPNMSMGLTQAFAGTLADEDGVRQSGSATAPFSLPDPGRPVPRLHAEDSEILVRDSQEQTHESDLMSNYNQSIARVSESPANHGFSQYSQLPDPTQDEGFVFSPFDPAKRFRETPPVSTVDTILVGQSQSPIAEKKRKQLRRGRAADLSVVEEEDNEGDFEINANAFNVMKKASKKSTAPYDKKNSKAKGIVDEAAEESEDEYAGIGGASDESDGEEDAYDQQMINDQSGEVADEQQLAALNADHQRNRDEKDVAKLMRDITTGALRRRRGGGDDDLDLDDSDDERLARRREKQREFAKMRRALLADDKIGELAENPKKAAFFKAIEDREVEDDFELDFLEEEGGSQGESQDVVSQEQADDSKKRKRPLEPTAEDATNRPPPHLRRTPASAMSKKPATLAEIRETLSFLTETPEYDSFHEDASIDEDDGAEGVDSNISGTDEAYSDDGVSQSKDGFAVPTNPRRTRRPVVDRLALLRQASSNSATTSGSSNTKMAFHSGGNSEGPIGFRPPQLLRRVTGGSTSSNSSTASANRVTKPGASGPKKGGAVNSYTAAREHEREKQLRMKQRSGGTNIAKLLNKHAGGGLGALAGKGQWD